MWDKISKARAMMRHTGFLRTLQLTIHRTIPRWLFDYNSLIAVRIDFADCPQPPKDSKRPHRWADEKDEELIGQMGMPTAEIRAFVAEGAYAAICEQDGNLVGCTWYVPSDHTVFDWIRVKVDKEVHCRAAYVAPEYRGLRVHDDTQAFAYSGMYALGHPCLVSFVESLNRIALRTGVPSPRRFLGRISFVRLLGLVIYCRDGRKWGAGLWNERRPFELSFDDFDETTFEVNNKDALSSLDQV